MAIDWLRDLDAGRPLTPYPSPYHETGELRVNEDEMLEVLVAPFEQENGSSSVEDAGECLAHKQCSKKKH